MRPSFFRRSAASVYRPPQNPYLRGRGRGFKTTKHHNTRIELKSLLASDSLTSREEKLAHLGHERKTIGLEDSTQSSQKLLYQRAPVTQKLTECTKSYVQGHVRQQLQDGSTSHVYIRILLYVMTFVEGGVSTLPYSTVPVLRVLRQ